MADLPVPVAHNCPECRRDFPYLVDCADGRERCWECSRGYETAVRRRHEGALLLARIDVVVAGELKRAGLSPREARSTVEGITEAISTASGLSLAPFLRGVTPRRGLGLLGPAGVGKSGALAAVLGACMHARLTRDLPEQGGAALSPWLVWLSWPETVNGLRVGSMRDGGLQEAEEFVQQAGRIEVLVIDDLGAERLRGSYVEDWAASQLDLIVDARYRADRRTWFTSTLDPQELIHRYGQRLFSRLSSEGDLVQLPRSGDRRIREGR